MSFEGSFWWLDALPNAIKKLIFDKIYELPPQVKLKFSKLHNKDWN